MLDEGEAHIGFLCGLPYVVNVDGPSPSLNLLAAPVLQGSRYAGKPVCYSDLLVRAESPFTDLSELMGKDSSNRYRAIINWMDKVDVDVDI